MKARTIFLLAIVLDAIVLSAQAPVGFAALQESGQRTSLSPTSGTSRVSRAMLIAMEESFDKRVQRLWTDNPLTLLGQTRGIYLGGYGAVFTAEVNLVPGPGLMMMRGPITKEEAAQHRAKKLDRITELKRAMRQALVETAASLDPVPSDEQIVIVAFLSKYPWEDMKNVPMQVSMQATKAKLVEAQRTLGAAADAMLDQAINIQTVY